ncbi:MAG: tyrosine-type recombinase/integrase [Dongiaceae bacterium]
MKPSGRHPINALTAVQVRTLKEPGRYADGGGLYLEVEPSGAKRWTLRLVVQGKRRDIGLGSAQLVGLAEARDAALAMRKTARAGGDPLADRNKARAVVPTFEEAVRRVHGDRKDGWRNPKHRQQFLNTLQTYAFPILGSMPVNKIETPHVLQALAPIWTSKPETARRVRQRIRAVLDWATAAGLREGVNPVEGVSKGLQRQQDRPQHHAAMLPADVPQFIRDLHQSSAGPMTALALEFLILTACRTGEVLGATWAEVDTAARIWTVPAERMKGGRPHRVPLSARALEILDNARQLSGGSGLVFPGRKRGKPQSQMTLLAVMRRMGSDAVPHGFRSTFRDWAAESNPAPREVAEAALAHIVKDKVERAYARSDHLERRRELMKAWAAHCIPAGGNVVELPLFGRAGVAVHA